MSRKSGFLKFYEMHLPEAQEQARITNRDLPNKRTEVCEFLFKRKFVIILFFLGTAKSDRHVVFTITDVQRQVSFFF